MTDFAATKAMFSLPEGILYLDGNSLGALPKATLAKVQDTVEQQWGEDLIRSWNQHDWINWPDTLGSAIAPLIGAKAHEVIVCDSYDEMVKVAASEGENGTGVCGEDTILIGAFSELKAFCATKAETSVAILQRGWASSTTTRRPVFSTLSRILSSSIGEVVRKSITSH